MGLPCIKINCGQFSTAKRNTIAETTLGNTKKDQIYLVLEGLDQVDFGTKDMVECLESVQAGTMLSGDDSDVNNAPCAAWDKDLGW